MHAHGRDMHVHGFCVCVCINFFVMLEVDLETAFFFSVMHFVH